MPASTDLLFHLAARDGFLAPLREATRRDCNRGDEDGLTPAAWAAWAGHLDALRMLVGRGANPDRPDHLGRTCLHHAAARGRMNCVSFLVSFGANVWALDNEFHSALDAAALHGRQEILRYLDMVCSKQELQHKKSVRKLREKAIHDAKANIRKYEKLQHQAMKAAEREDRRLQKAIDKGYRSGLASVSGTLQRSAAAGNVSSRLSAPPTSSSSTEPKPFSAHFATISRQPTTKMGAVARMIRRRKDSSVSEAGGDFKVCEVSMDGSRTLRSLSGLQRDHHVMYVRPPGVTPPAGARDGGSVSSSASSGSSLPPPRLPWLPRTNSEPDFYYAPDSGIDSPDPAGDTGGAPAEGGTVWRTGQRHSTGMFTRPGFGEVAFITKNITAIERDEDDDEEDEGLGQSTSQLGSSAATLTGTSSRLDPGSTDTLTPGRHHHHSSDNVFASTSSCVTDGSGAVADRLSSLWLTEDDDDDLSLFLASCGTSHFLPLFHREKVDLPALLLLSDVDLQQLGLPLGPRRKLLQAIRQRNEVLRSPPGHMYDSFL